VNKALYLVTKMARDAGGQANFRLRKTPPSVNAAIDARRILARHETMFRVL